MTMNEAEVVTSGGWAAASGLCAVCSRVVEQDDDAVYSFGVGPAGRLPPSAPPRREQPP